jgi:hypothetical protein
VQAELVEEEDVSGLEDRPHDRHPTGRLGDVLLGDGVAEHRPLGPRLDKVVEAAGDEVQSRCLVAAARQRGPDVERSHVAHEVAVLVPGAGDRGVGLAQRRLLGRERDRLAEVAANHLQQAGPLEGVERCEGKSRAVDREDAAALRDPAPRERHGEAGVGLELVVVAVGDGLARVAAVALLEGAVDLLRERQRLLGIDQAADQQRAVAKDPGAKQLRGQVRSGDVGQAIALRQPLEVGRRVAGVRRGLVDQPDPGEVAKAQQLSLDVTVAARAVRLAQPPDLGEQLLGARGLAVGVGRSVGNRGASVRSPAPKDHRLPAAVAATDRKVPVGSLSPASGLVQPPRALPAPEEPPGRPVTVAPGGTSSTTTAPAPTFAPAPIRTAPITFAPVPMLTSRSIVGPLTSPARRPIVTNGPITVPEWISTRPSTTIWPWTT